MKYFRNKKLGIVTKEYRELMNTPKRAMIIKKMYNENTLRIGYETEKQFAQIFKHKVVVDKYCPKIMECGNVYNCCICENLEKFSQVSDEARIKAAKDIHELYVGNLISQICTLECSIRNFKSKEELQKELDKLNNDFEQSDSDLKNAIEKFENRGIK